MKKERVYALLFASIYPLYIKKAEAKGRTKGEVDTVIFWLTGYDKQQIDKKNDLETFFAQAPHDTGVYGGKYTRRLQQSFQG